MSIQQNFTYNPALPNRSRVAIGAMGEQRAAQLLRQSGYKINFTHYGEKQGDLRATNRTTGQIYRVEVKTAHRSKDNKWRFTLYVAGCTDHRHADVVMLLAVLECGRIVHFVVPIDILRNQRQAVITSHPETYKGKLATYRTQGAIQL